MTFNKEAFKLHHMTGEYLVDDALTPVADEAKGWLDTVAKRIPLSEDKTLVKKNRIAESENLLSHRTLEGFSADFIFRIDRVMDGMREDNSYPFGLLYLTDGCTFLMQINRSNEGDGDVPDKQVRRIRITSVQEEEDVIETLKRVEDPSHIWGISLWVQKDLTKNTHDIIYFDTESEFRWSETKDEKGKRAKLPIANTTRSVINVEEQIDLMEYLYEAFHAASMD